MAIKLNDDKEQVEYIKQKLKENKEKYSKQYCPCVLPNNHNEDTICPCKEFREMEEGMCHCGLFIKTND